MNFTYIMIPPPTVEFGSKTVNETWTGMVGQLYRGEIDIGIFFSNNMTGGFSHISKTFNLDFIKPERYKNILGLRML